MISSPLRLLAEAAVGGIERRSSILLRLFGVVLVAVGLGFKRISCIATVAAEDPLLEVVTEEMPNKSGTKRRFSNT